MSTPIAVHILNKVRCSWAGNDPLYCAYHDNEWGVPLHDDKRLFEMLILEGFQAGLSWITILRKRENFRRAFDYWDWNKIARYTQKDIDRLMKDPGIIRNSLKIMAAIENAKAFIKIRKEFGSFDSYIWSFTNFCTLKPRQRAKTWKDVPTESPESRAISRDMKRRGFRFVGPKIIYAHMQATGMVDDHMENCWKSKV